MGEGLRDLDWLVPISIIVLIELAFAWLMGFALGYSVIPPLLFYMVQFVRVTALAIFTLFGLMVVREMRRGTPQPTKWILTKAREHRTFLSYILMGLLLAVLQFTALTWLKPTLPMVGGFWADPLLADWDAALFGGDPWRPLHAIFGPANYALDLIYHAWLPVVLSAFALVLCCRPSPWKTRAVTSYFLATVIGMVFQFALPSAGPVFYERAGFGDRFAAMQLPSFTTIGTDYLWLAHTGEMMGAAVGISAMPSMHVVLATWVALAARPFRIFPLAVLWLTSICIGSVYLGMHYALDGIAGIAIALLAYVVAIKMTAPVSSWVHVIADRKRQGG
jgi:hypothetical protein